MTYLTVITEGSDEFLDNFEFTTEKCIFALLHFVFVHAKKLKIDTRNSGNQALVGS